MAKRKRRRERSAAPASDYADADGKVHTLRRELSGGTVRKLRERPRSQAASVEDAWQRREEALFERLVVRWDIAGLPIDDQKMLLGRYRMASAGERRWVQATIARHLEEFIPELS
jgi:hypothetical protein